MKSSSLEKKLGIRHIHFFYSQIQSFVRQFAKYFATRLFQNRTFAKLFRFRQPPILLLSYPRSGSSWIGDILATSPSVAYLREPITQPFIKSGGLDLDPITNSKAVQAYQRLSQNAFLGIAPLDCYRWPFFFDYIPPLRGRKRLLIKEVNPNACSFFYKQNRPIFVLLLRHPAALALSFIERGWLDSDKLEIWGQQYGEIMTRSLAVVPSENCRLVLYEEIAENPKIEFRELFNYLGLRVPNKYDRIISNYCYSHSETSWPWETKRNSKNQIDKWRNRLTAEQIESLRVGYFNSPLKYYRKTSDWQILSN